jgi:hypothetical protein
LDDDLRKRNYRFLARVFNLLVDGNSQSQIAKILIIKGENSESSAKKRVSKATKYLVDQGYLEKVINVRPFHYHRGKNATEFEKVISSYHLNKRVDTILLPGNHKNDPLVEKSSPELIRLHESSFNCKITILPSDRKLKKNGFTWQKEYEMKGIKNRTSKIEVYKIGWIFLRETISDNKKTLYFALPPQYINIESLPDAQKFIEDCSFRVVKIMAKFGYGLGLPEISKKTTYAFREPSFDNSPVRRVITESGTQIDFSRSPDNEFAEWESSDLKLVDIKARMPEIVSELQESIQDIKSLPTDIKALSEALIDLKGNIAELQTDIVDLKKSVSEIQDSMTFKPDTKKREGYV